MTITIQKGLFALADIETIAKKSHTKQDDVVSQWQHYKETENLVRPRLDEREQIFLRWVVWTIEDAGVAAHVEVSDRLQGSDPMFFENESKIEEHEPTAVDRDPSDQKIVQPGQTGADTPEAQEKLKKKGMTKAGD
ncbi:MAG TPA: hypothetical protein VF884_06550 [Nitrososphaeraceae archaeon]